ncbi:unnamed protein product, partial [Mycena citricolor]
MIGPRDDEITDEIISWPTLYGQDVHMEAMACEFLVRTDCRAKMRQSEPCSKSQVAIGIRQLECRFWIATQVRR